MGVIYFAFRTCRIWNKGSQEKKHQITGGGGFQELHGKN